MKFVLSSPKGPPHVSGPWPLEWRWTQMKPKKITILGNALHAVFAWCGSKTANGVFEGNALTRKSPVNHFLGKQNCWAILGGWSGKRAQKGPIEKYQLSIPGQIGNIFHDQLPKCFFFNIWPNKLKLIFQYWWSFLPMTLKLKLVKCISSSYGKTLKCPVNFFFTNVSLNGPTGNHSLEHLTHFSPSLGSKMSTGPKRW